MSYRLSIFAVTLVFLVVLSVGLVPRSASAQVRVSGLAVAADRNEYLGPCPTEIKLRGKLQADAPLGVLRYQFVHSDGTQSAVSQLAIYTKGVFTVEETLRKNASWNDTVFLRVFFPAPPLAPIPMDSNRITIKGECQTLQTVPRQASISLGPASGHFRVTLNGFTCNRQTLDNPSLPDGADDEVFLFTKVFPVTIRADGYGVNPSSLLRRRTQAIGDTGSVNFPGRVQGGSNHAGAANGGFRAGDSFPSAPEQHSTNPQPYALPQLIWEGELTRRQNAVVIIPTIWEWDGIDPLFQAWESAGLDQLSNVAALIANPNLTDQESAKVALRGEVVGQVSIIWKRAQEGLDRPIGMQLYGNTESYRFRPEVLILTYDEALRMVDQSRRKNGEAFKIVYADAPELGGNYTLYIQVEQMP